MTTAPHLPAGGDAARQWSPAAERNREPILAVLREILPAHGTVLEIASGTGQHAVHFAAALPTLAWQPSDADPAARASVAAWAAQAALSNLRAPLALDVCETSWPLASADALVCCNMIHIAPWRAAEGLFAGAARVLPGAGAPLVLYGPFRRAGAHTAPSNAAFDAQLRERDPAWGVRDLEAVVALGDAAGFAFDAAIPMPANNFCVVFRRLPAHRGA
ncbi:class I SAM-dependent methyltransferase [Burkholderia sp. FERM BP-3421]|jgi:SAM-dependent methyltransferase|uniref:DUF938 domain-containing protein n=1 Tax=Burkholderia sp. FERM BP-3421 TaxID=1494466 RepID=UPI00236298BB|nr:DUF938 domain-containing protein [Burkholderia sp. FERM BP-3421]WDD92765.1 class I SAM-dependent methyltransferase [Burkholderia sp. FERM BP-3421]